MTREVVATGCCQCGAVRYALYGAPEGSFCHCRMCQRATGGIFAALAGLSKSDFAWTKGNPLLFESSSASTRGFCRDCGTPLSFAYNEGGWTNVTIGSLDEPERTPVTVHHGVESRLPWLKLCDGLLEEVTSNVTEDPRLDGMVSNQSKSS